ncbi:057L [Invertebrate iridescent virus 6]|uniref:057L n=1 Tax=Invertebrate iridescent virus 6 TaxID=176652 RepID=Q91G44_IIV6|nr:057L [Invertebrate iridescent virus 6]AAK81988.1 057L [Invertebrate iridescent virus 6]QMS79627.1 hypothetical protein IIV6-T1_062 [Invertebrate iridescent virus 6]
MWRFEFAPRRFLSKATRFHSWKRLRFFWGGTPEKTRPLGQDGRLL